MHKRGVLYGQQHGGMRMKSANVYLLCWPNDNNKTVPRYSRQGGQVVLFALVRLVPRVKVVTRNICRYVVLGESDERLRIN
jgi:hypothetical protein